MSNVITVLYSNVLGKMKTLKNVERIDAEDRQALTLLANALKLESPVYAIICKNTALPQLVMLRDAEKNISKLAILLFSEKEVAEQEAMRWGTENVFVADLPKFLLKDKVPIDIRSAFYEKCRLLVEEALLNPHDGKAELRIPMHLLAEAAAESDQDKVNRHVNGAITLLKQETCAGKLAAPLLFEKEVMQKMRFAFFLLPTMDSHPLIFNDQEYGNSLYLFMNRTEATAYKGELSSVLLEDLLPLIEERKLPCVINPFSLKFYLDGSFIQRYKEIC